MKRERLFLSLLLTLNLMAGLFLGGCKGDSAPALRVVAGTTLISAIVAEVGGGRVTVTSIVPPTTWPDDFKPDSENVKVLSDSSLFIIHDWQSEKFTEEIVSQAGNQNLLIEKIALGGDWMIPPVQSAATDKVAEVLVRFDSKNSSAYKKAAEDYKKRIRDKETQLKNRAALAYKSFIARNIDSFNVICADTLGEYINWMGLNVIDTYGRPDSMTPEVAKKLVTEGRDNKVVLVVDSLQYNKDVGVVVALGAGALRTVLSNYPDGLKNTETWEKAIDRNTGLLLGALEEC